MRSSGSPGPLVPGLRTRTFTFVFCGAICVEPATAVAVWSFVAIWPAVCVAGAGGGGGRRGVRAGVSAHAAVAQAAAASATSDQRYECSSHLVAPSSRRNAPGTASRHGLNGSRRLAGLAATFAGASLPGGCTLAPSRPADASHARNSEATRIAKLWNAVAAPKPPEAGALPSCSGLPGHGNAGCRAGRGRAGALRPAEEPSRRAPWSLRRERSAGVAAMAAATTTGCATTARARSFPGVPLSRREMGAAAVRARLGCVDAAGRSTGAAEGEAGGAGGALNEALGAARCLDCRRGIRRCLVLRIRRLVPTRCGRRIENDMPIVRDIYRHRNRHLRGTG